MLFSSPGQQPASFEARASRYIVFMAEREIISKLKQIPNHLHELLLLRPTAKVHLLDRFDPAADGVTRDVTAEKCIRPPGLARRHFESLMQEIFFLTWFNNTMYAATIARFLLAHSKHQ